MVRLHILPFIQRSYLDLPLQYNSRNFDSLLLGCFADTSATARAWMSGVRASAILLKNETL